MADSVSKNRSPSGASNRPVEQGSEPSPVEKIVAQNQARRPPAKKIGGDEKGPRNSIGLGLLRIAEPDAPLASVPQESAKLRQITRRGDQENISDPSDHENRQWIVNHRLVIDGEELLRDGFGDRMQARGLSASEKDAAHVPLFSVFFPKSQQVQRIEWTHGRSKGTGVRSMASTFCCSPAP